MSASTKWAIFTLNAYIVYKLSLSNAFILIFNSSLTFCCNSISAVNDFFALPFSSNNLRISLLLQSSKFFKWLISFLSYPISVSFISKMFFTYCSLICLSLAFSLVILLAWVTSVVAISSNNSSFSLFKCYNSMLCISSLFAIFLLIIEISSIFSLS